MQRCNTFTPFAFLLECDVYYRKEEEGRKPRETNPDLACKDRRLGNEHTLSLDRRVVIQFFVVLGSEIQLCCIPLAASLNIRVHSYPWPFVILGTRH